MNTDYTTIKIASNQLSSRVEKVSEFRRIHQDLRRVAQSITDSEGNEYPDRYVTDDGQLNMPNLLVVAREGLWRNPALEWLNVAAVATISKPEGTEIVTVWNEGALKSPDYFLFIHSNAFIPESAVGPALSHQTGMFMRVVDGFIAGVVTVDYINFSSTVELYPFVLIDTIKALAPHVLMAPDAQLVRATSAWDMNSQSNLEVPVFTIRSPANLQQYESIFKSIQVMDLDGLCQTWTLAAGALLVQVVKSTVSDNVIPEYITAFQRDFNITEGIDSHITIFRFLLQILTEYANRNDITIRKSSVRRTSDGDTQMVDRDTGEVAVRYRNNRERVNGVAPRADPYRRKSLERILRRRKRDDTVQLRRGSDARPFKKRNM